MSSIDEDQLVPDHDNIYQEDDIDAVPVKKKTREKLATVDYTQEEFFRDLSQMQELWLQEAHEIEDMEDQHVPDIILTQNEIKIKREPEDNQRYLPPVQEDDILATDLSEFEIGEDLLVYPAGLMKKREPGPPSPDVIIADNIIVTDDVLVTYVFPNGNLSEAGQRQKNLERSHRLAGIPRVAQDIPEVFKIGSDFNGNLTHAESVTTNSWLKDRNDQIKSYSRQNSETYSGRANDVSSNQNVPQYCRQQCSSSALAHYALQNDTSSDNPYCNKYVPPQHAVVKQEAVDNGTYGASQYYEDDSMQSYSPQSSPDVQPVDTCQKLGQHSPANYDSYCDLGIGSHPDNHNVDPHWSNYYSATYARRGSMQLWQFLVVLLEDTNRRAFISWTGRGLEFKLLQPEEVARLWGIQKNRPAMNYDKLSRSLRYYYEKGIMQKVSGERYVYKFVCDPASLFSTSPQHELGHNPYVNVGGSHPWVQGHRDLPGQPHDEIKEGFFRDGFSPKPLELTMYHQNRCTDNPATDVPLQSHDAYKTITQYSGHRNMQITPPHTAGSLVTSPRPHVPPLSPIFPGLYSPGALHPDRFSMKSETTPENRATTNALVPLYDV